MVRCPLCAAAQQLSKTSALASTPQLPTLAVQAPSEGAAPISTALRGLVQAPAVAATVALCVALAHVAGAGLDRDDARRRDLDLPPADEPDVNESTVSNAIENASLGRIGAASALSLYATLPLGPRLPAATEVAADLVGDVVRGGVEGLGLERAAHAPAVVTTSVAVEFEPVRHSLIRRTLEPLNIGKTPGIPNNLIISGAVHGQMLRHCLGVVCQTLPVLR